MARSQRAKELKEAAANGDGEKGLGRTPNLAPSPSSNNAISNSSNATRSPNKSSPGPTALPAPAIDPKSPPTSQAPDAANATTTVRPTTPGSLVETAIAGLQSKITASPTFGVGNPSKVSVNPERSVSKQKARFENDVTSQRVERAGTKLRAFVNSPPDVAKPELPTSEKAEKADKLQLGPKLDIIAGDVKTSNSEQTEINIAEDNVDTENSAITENILQHADAPNVQASQEAQSQTDANRAELLEIPEIKVEHEIGETVTWGELLQRVIDAISQLNNATKLHQQELYASLNDSIISSIQNVLKCSGAMYKDSTVLRDNPRLITSHKALLAASSRLNSATQTASTGPNNIDGVNEMRFQAGQLLSALRAYISEAQSLSITLAPPTTGPADTEQLFDLRNSNVAEAEIPTRLAAAHNALIVSVAALVGRVSADKKASQSLVQMTTAAVGHFTILLALIEDLRPVQPEYAQILIRAEGDLTATAPRVLVGSGDDRHLRETFEQFAARRADAYTSVKDLVGATRASLDDFAPSDALKNIMEAAIALLKTVDELVIITKNLIDEHVLTEEQKLRYTRTLTSSLSSISKSRSQTQLATQKHPSNASVDNTPVPEDVIARSQHELNNLGEEGSASGVVRESARGTTPTARYTIQTPAELGTPAERASNTGSQRAVSTPPVGGSRTGTGSRVDIAEQVGRAVAGVRAGSSSSLAKNARMKGLHTPPPATMGASIESVASAKITKFFGEEDGTVAAKKVYDMERENSMWYLKYDHDGPDELQCNMEGQVIGTTMAALIERLTLHDKPIDQAIFYAFFTTFRVFVAPVVLVDHITNRFQLACPEDLAAQELALWAEKKLIPIRLRVFNFLKMWLDKYWIDQFDEGALDKLNEFVRETMAPILPGPAKQLTALIQRKASSSTSDDPSARARASHNRLSAIPSSFNGTSVDGPISTNVPGAPTIALSKSMLSALRNKPNSVLLVDMDALEVARQLTIIESRSYCKIKSQDLIAHAFSGKKKELNLRTPHVQRMTEISTQITGWVAGAILREADTKKRANVLKHFIKIADKCLVLYNYNTLMGIMCALKSSTITRLKKTWDLVGNKNMIMYDALRKATDHSRNYSEYRATLRSLVPPCLPFIGLYLTDLIFIADGNPPIRNNNPDMINFDKYVKVSRILQEIYRFQEPYVLNDVPELQDYLKNCLLMYKDGGDVNELYKKSHLIEPPEPGSV